MFVGTAWADGYYLLGEKVSNLTAGKYVIKAKSDKGEGACLYGASFKESKYYRYATDVVVSSGAVLQSDFVWDVAVVGENKITISWADDNTKFFVKDAAKNQNFTGTEKAELILESHTIGGEDYFALKLENAAIGYIHANAPDGYPCLSYWDGYGDGGSCVKFQFYPATITDTPENPIKDGAKLMFLNKQHGTYMGVYFEGGELDNDPAPTSHKLSSTKDSYSYKNCFELKATTFENTECFQLYNPYYGWYVGKIEARNGAVNMAATSETAGCYAIETVINGFAFKCLNKTTTQEYSYLHQVDWGGYAVVDWNKDAEASQWSCVVVTDDMENEWLTAITSEVADKKAYLEARELGSGIGQYSGIAAADKSEVLKSLAIPAEGTTAEKIKAGVYVMYPLNALALNMPTAGFYRIKSLNGNDANKAGKYWQIKADSSAMEAGADKTINSIVYVKSNANKYNIVSYASGLYLNKYKDVDPVGTEAKAWSFVENTSVVGSYALYASADPHPAYCLSDWYGITYGQKDANAAWTFEPVEALPVEVSAAGYATLYAPVALTLADGVEAYYVSAKSATSATMTQVTGVIPANTAVVLKAAKGTYNLAVASEADAISGNLLTGTLGSEFVAADAYVLSKQEEGVGFYKAKLNISTNTENDGAEGEEDDTYEAFLNNGFKAYLPASSVSGARFISFDFGTETAIENIEGAEVENAVVYDLSGRRVQKAQKGLYIVNGKKVVK